MTTTPTLTDIGLKTFLREVHTGRVRIWWVDHPWVVAARANGWATTSGDESYPDVKLTDAGRAALESAGLEARKEGKL